MKKHLEQLTCPFCGEPSPWVRYQITDDHCIVKCGGCGLMWLHPRPSLDELHEIYDEGYYHNEEFYDSGGASLYGYYDYIYERINKQYTYQKMADRADEMLGRDRHEDEQPPAWLDVGCGLGFLMDVAFDHGYGVHGVEFNPYAVKAIQAKYTFPVTCGSIHDLDQDRRFEVISLFDVIEHLDDPFGDLGKLRSLVAEDGLLMLQTMDSESVPSRIIGKRLEDFRRFREHLYFFSRKSITRVLEAAGWEVADIVSVGHTFQLEMLLDRIALYTPRLVKVLKFLVWPKWLLDANIYVNPHTKMMVYARPKAGWQGGGGDGATGPGAA